ncbi:MAG: flap endonuclease-1 [Candidatus Aenigmarchaeota archaeon]|nr:flap endonuclease-1 [Candidatus Aenigmarchaeota archaeon]MDW8149587.1 flap endonuclease-1 [Candidatus Aenigmarchaeota archaeon]
MGVKIGEITIKKEVELEFFSGKKIAIDAHNYIYQFLTTIRDRETGEPLRDEKGRITSHISGLFYRTINLIENGIKPILVFDGEPPKFKKSTLEIREKRKEEAEKKWLEALESGEEAMKYAQASARLSEGMVKECKELLDYMGVNYIDALSEGEAQCAFMCKKNFVDYSCSQDYDSLLFGSPFLARNLSLSGKRKLPGKDIYVEIKPEIISLEETLKQNNINQEQLIIIGILIGTDYNVNGVKGIGIKTALKLVKEYRTLDKILKTIKWEFDVDPFEILEFFKNPPINENIKLEQKEVNKEKIIKFMVDERNFSIERVEKYINILIESLNKGKQTGLSSFLKK